MREGANEDHVTCGLVAVNSVGGKFVEIIAGLAPFSLARRTLRTARLAVDKSHARTKKVRNIWHWGQTGRITGSIIGVLGFGLCTFSAGAAEVGLGQDWPQMASVIAITGKTIEFPSHSPFTLTDAGNGPETNPLTQARGTLFLPPGASAADPVPAVVLLHGAGGVVGAREPTYARQLAAMGVAALVVDAFGARKDMADRFVDRLLKITEMMLVADAYAALDYLVERPEVDGKRVALVGFSYGGMASIYSAYEQVAERVAINGVRFAGHVAFYAPCIARFDDYRTTRAPVLILAGAEDAVVDQKRCAEIAGDLRRGGSAVDSIVYAGAYHQWDGRYAEPRSIGRNFAGCRLKVNRSGQVHDRSTKLPMTGPISRRFILAACVDRKGYMAGRNDSVRARSNRDLGRFLTAIFGESKSLH